MLRGFSLPRQHAKLLAVQGKIVVAMGRRLLVYALGLAAVLVAGLALALWGLAACAPPPLPGDELWTWRQMAGTALAIVGRAQSVTCFTGEAAAATALWVAARTGLVLAAIIILALMWESLGQGLRRLWFRLRGGHALLAGEWSDIAGLARTRFAGRVYLPPSEEARAPIARRHPFAAIALADRDHIAADLRCYGARRAALVAAVTRNDLTNVAMADAALATPGMGALLVRLEQPAVRALSAHRLRLAGEETDRSVSVVSLTQMQTRRGAAAAMSGRYTIEGDPRVHIALCGSGEALEAAAFDIVRQGFGLDLERPLLSILRTGHADFSAGALDRLQASAAAEVRVLAAAAGFGLDRAIADIVLDAPPLLALHCASPAPGEAEALARRWEDVLVGLRRPVPPIIAYSSAASPIGRTGMIRMAVAPDLAEARDLAELMDARARAVHAAFLNAQRAARGGAFGAAPAEVEWTSLPEAFRDDNRAVADQMEFKLAQIFMLTQPGGDGVALAPADIETLARTAHARWWAAKALAGWHLGDSRDDRLQLHPDMQPYDLLSEPVKQKDRDEVASLPAMAALAGEALRRERRLGLTQALDAAALARLRTTLASTPKTHVPVVVIDVGADGVLPVAQGLLDVGVYVELVLDAATGTPAAPALLRRAWRIHVVPDGSAAAAIHRRVSEIIESTGAVHALA